MMQGLLAALTPGLSVLRRILQRPGSLKRNVHFWEELPQHSGQSKKASKLLV